MSRKKVSEKDGTGKSRQPLAERAAQKPAATSEEKYRLVFENMAEGIALYELLYDDNGKPVDWRVLEVNDAYSLHTGIPREQIEGRCMSDILPEAIPEYLGRFADVVAGQKTVEFETYAKLTDRYQHVVSFPAGPHCFANAITDITGRRRAEERNAHLASFPQLNPNPVLEVDASGRITFFNPVSVKILESIGRDKADIVVFLPSDIKDILESWDRSKETTLYREVVIEEKAFGEVIFLTPQFNVARIYAYDITERKRAEDERGRLLVDLQRSATELDAVLKMLPYLVSVHDKDGRYLRVNQAVVDLFGFDPTAATREEIARRVQARFPDGRPVTPENMPSSRALKGEPVTEVEYVITNERGEEHVLLINAIPLKQGERVYGAVLSQLDITERKRAEEALRKSEMKYRSLFENMINGFAYHRIVLDERGKPVDYVFLEANDAFERLTGLRRGDIVGRCVRKVLPGIENDPADWIGKYGRVALTGRETRFEQYAASLHKWYSVTAYSPQKEHFVTIFEDITERKEAEEALRNSEQRLRFHVENSPLAVVEWDTNFIVTRWSDEAERIFGWSAAETVGRPIMDLNMIFEEDIPLVEETMRKLTDGASRKVVSSNRNRTKDGRVIHCEWYNSVLLDEHGKMSSVMSQVLDVTAPKQAEETIRASEQKLRLFIEHAPAAIAMFDRDMNYLSASLRWYTDYHIGNQNILGRNHYEVLPDLPGQWREINSRCLAGAVEQSDADLWIRADGTAEWVRWEIRPWYKAGSEIGGVIIFSENITELKEKEMELQTLNSELEQRVAERTAELRNLQAHVEAVREGERAYIAREVHDQLGQVLTALKMDIAWMNRHHPSRDAAIRERSAEMLGLVDGAIQSVKRITSELRPSVLDDFGLQAAIEWTAQEFGKRSGVKCRILSRPASITMDRTRSTVIYRVLQESLTNVARHAKAKNVTVSLDLEGERFRMTVQDDGKGIPAEKIGDPSSYGLMGMRERVRFLGGDISISGRRGLGTTVIVSLPMSGADGPANGADRPGPPGASNEQQPDGETGEIKEARP